MISVIVYGRNDNHGYNLHKRAAISINALCALLDDDDDELIFVDYNTPDDFPSFPEAIQDTLTERARERLRIFRVRESVHARIGQESPLPVIEPICRNVGIRRSNPANKWILSTNTDIILLPRQDKSFGEILRGLKPGFYQAPRMELPEALWESFDRREPIEIMRTVRQLAPALHLDEIAYGNDSIMFDGPGDFQLMDRDVLFSIDSFNEAMNRGWHVDANMAVRMALHHGRIESLSDQIFAYHCDHTRQVTPAHRAGRQENDVGRFVTNVARADIPEQRDIWGLAGEEIESFTLADAPSRRFADITRAAVGEAAPLPYECLYAEQSYDKVGYDARHVLPFLVDLLISAPRTTRLAWIGAQGELLHRFAKTWVSLGFTNPILLAEAYRDQSCPTPDGTAFAPKDAMIDCADIFLFDFGGEYQSDPTDNSSDPILGEMLFAVRGAETVRLEKQKARRRVIGVNVVHNRYERVFAGVVAAAATPFATRVRHGFARPLDYSTDWLNKIEIQNFERSGDGAVICPPRPDNWTIVTPGYSVDPGYYDLHVVAEALEPGRTGARLVVDARYGADVMIADVLNLAPEDSSQWVLPFKIDGAAAFDPTRGLTIRVKAHGDQAIRLVELSTHMVVNRAQLPRKCRAVLGMIGTDRDWLPFSSIGRAGKAEVDHISVRSGVKGHIFYGPYWALPKGRYQAKVRLEKAGGGSFFSMGRIKADAALATGFILGSTVVHHPLLVNRKVLTVEFEISEEMVDMPVELRLWTSQRSDFYIKKVTLDQVLHL